MMSMKTLIIILTVLTGYSTSTWFAYGSLQPCEILVALQKDYHIGVAEKRHQEDLQCWQELARKALPASDYERFVRNTQEYSSSSSRAESLQQSVVKELHEKFRGMSHAECAWEAVNWQPPAE